MRGLYEERYMAGFGAELRATLPIAAPLVAANLAQMAMGLTNMIMVGRLGGAALSAAGLGAGLYFTLMIVCQSVLTAVAPLAAGAIGARNHRAAGEIASAGLVLAALAAVPIIALLSVTHHLLAALGYDAALAAEIGHFLNAIRWAAPAFLVFGVLRALLAAASRARIVMLVVLIGIPANAALNWLLIFGRLGVPAYGIAGSGWATAIIQTLMALGLVVVVLWRPLHTPIRLGSGVAERIGQILRLGLPIGGIIALEVGVFATSGIVIGLFGADALGAHQLVINFAALTFMVPLGIGQGATVRVGYELGARAPAVAQRAAAVALLLGTAAMMLTALLMWTAPRMIIGMYLDLDDPENAGLIAIARHLLVIAGVFQIFDGVQAVAAGALRGYRDTAIPMLYAGIGYWVIGFAGGWVLAFPLGHGPVGLWWGLALGLAVVAVLLTVRLRGRAVAAGGRGRSFPPAAAALPKPPKPR